MTGAIILQVVNTTQLTVMITMLVLTTLVMNKQVVLILMLKLMIITNVHMIIVALLKEFTTLINQFLLMMPVQPSHVILVLDSNLLL
jgi:hypothetical protein